MSILIYLYTHTIPSRFILFCHIYTFALYYMYLYLIMTGKIMRRILRKVAASEEDSIGDISTLADPSVVARLIEQFKALSAPAPLSP